MGQTTLSVRMDEDVKRRFDDFCAEVGINASVAVNLFAKAVLREGRIPFEIAVNPDPFWRPENQAALRRSKAQLEEGRVVRKTLEQLEAMENG